jgi:charged multivesicular body protein 4A/B
MWSWFGGQSAQKRKEAPKNAILMLRNQLDMLQKREKHLETLISEQDAVARKNISANKNGRLPNMRLGYESQETDVLDSIQLPKRLFGERKFMRRIWSKRKHRSYS